MTGREIAAVAQVSARTVRRVAAEMYPTKHVTGKATTYSREEAVAIMDKLRKPGLVGHDGRVVRLAGQNVQVSPRPQIKSIALSGALVSQLERVMGRGDAKGLLCHLTGYVPIVERIALPDKAPDDLAEGGFRQLRLIAERGPDQPSLEEKP